jgi:predicted Zn finger-like uncharacterized protein
MTESDMPTLTACPSCGGQLRVPDELLGTTVRCPTCQTTFDAAPAPGPGRPPAPADPPPAPAWKGRALEVDQEEPTQPAPRGLKGAVELKLPGGEESTPPPRPAGAPLEGRQAPPSPRRPGPPPREPEPPGRSGPREGDWRRGRDPDPDPYYDRPGYDRPGYDRPGPRDPYFRDREPRRLDTVPHRGSLILTLGVLALVCTVLVLICIGPVVGIPLGITAWVMGHRDLRRIKNREMDEDGLSGTQAGWICGIIATVLNTLVLFTCLGLMMTGLFNLGYSSTAPVKTPFGQTAPAQSGDK